MSVVSLSSNIIVSAANLSDTPPPPPTPPPPHLHWLSLHQSFICFVFNVCCAQFPVLTRALLCWVVNPEYSSTFWVEHSPLPHTPPPTIFPPPPPPHLNGILSVGEHILDFPEDCTGRLDAALIHCFIFLLHLILNAATSASKPYYLPTVRHCNYSAAKTV